LKKRLGQEKSKRKKRKQKSFAQRQEMYKELFDTLAAEATHQMQGEYISYAARIYLIRHRKHQRET